MAAIGCISDAAIDLKVSATTELVTDGPCNAGISKLSQVHAAPCPPALLAQLQVNLQEISSSVGAKSCAGNSPHLTPLRFSGIVGLHVVCVSGILHHTHPTPTPDTLNYRTLLFLRKAI